MTAPWIGLAVAAAAAWALTHRLRRRRARRADLERTLRQALADAAGDDLALGELDFARLDGAARLPCDRLMALLDRGATVESVAAAAAEALRRPLSALADPLSLKIHGPRLAIHLMRPLTLELAARQPRPASTPLPELGLTATYRVDGRPDACLTDDHLRAAGVDARDAHRIALAVLRQEFDAGLVEAALAGRTVEVPGTEGRAAAALLVIPGFLPTGAALEAVLGGPDRLVLRQASETGGAEDPPGGGVRLRIDTAGFRIL